jgi:hypothetical protein
MREIRTEIDIDAPPAAVWAVLTDLESYPEWNPHVVAASGVIELGSTLDITVRRAGTRDRSMSVTVTELFPDLRLVWVGTLLAGAVFEGRHVFELEPLDGERTRLVNREEVRGVLAGLVTTDEPEVDYAKMNQALKRRVERAARRQPA